MGMSLDLYDTAMAFGITSTCRSFGSRSGADPAGCVKARSKVW